MRTKKSLEELIDLEARSLALGILESHLAKENLPLPKDSSLDLHINQLLVTNPQIHEAARDRVLAQQDAYSQSLQAIGLPGPDLGIPLDLDLDI